MIVKYYRKKIIALVLSLVLVIILGWQIENHAFEENVESLSIDGTILSELVLDPSDAKIIKKIQLNGDKAQESYVIVHFPGYPFFQRTSLGNFIQWDGTLENLEDNKYLSDTDSVMFDVYQGNLQGAPFPFYVYIAYLTDNGDLKYGLLAASSTNQSPIAHPISLQVNMGVRQLRVDLIATDADNDTLNYELLSPSSGAGYEGAVLNPQSGTLYLTLTGTEEIVTLKYRATDGMTFSLPAEVIIQVTTSDEDRALGLIEIDPLLYGTFDIADLYGNILGEPGSQPSLPTSIDLSSSFPTPGDQGNQGSCVGWATAYAVKSYQEKIEMGWDLNRLEHLFSPSFVYNQIKVGDCMDGSRIHDALDLIVNIGAATKDTMPYTDAECYTQPDREALQRASYFKAQRWDRLINMQSMKEALANRLPIIIGIPVFESFNYLRGPDSVYNTLEGLNLGGHAVTVVGYDDIRFGGAFRVINSWGTGWGDNGYFWLPYNKVAQLVSQAYVLYDAENKELIDPEPHPIEPIPPQNLPNLQIMNWSASYDPHPGGSGYLHYEIANSGTAVAPAGAYVNLMLSKTERINNSDIFVVYEPIQFDLAPGSAVYRDQSNPLPFTFPDNLPPGAYYMALWIDDLDTIQESDKSDNISIGSELVTIHNSLPDLTVVNWYATWNDNGIGNLIFKVGNIGQSTARSGWDVNLMLSSDKVIDSNDIYLWYETVPFALTPGQMYYRDWSAPAVFDISRVAPGTYWMALWLDDGNVVVEANKRNNVSLSGNPLSIGTYGSFLKNYNAEQIQDNRAYNGKPLPPNDVWVREVRITRSLRGVPQLEILNENENGGRIEKLHINHQKTNQASIQGIFPINNVIPMPSVSSDEN